MPTTSFGKELAEQVADRLVNCPLMHRHKMKAGRGIVRMEDGSFIYGEVADSQIYNPIIKFSARDKFVAWLSEQSEATLALKDRYPEENITRERLERYVKYSEKSTNGDF